MSLRFSFRCYKRSVQHSRSSLLHVSQSIEQGGKGTHVDAFGEPLTTLAESQEEVRELYMCRIVVGNLIAEND